MVDVPLFVLPPSLSTDPQIDSHVFLGSTLVLLYTGPGCDEEDALCGVPFGQFLLLVVIGFLGECLHAAKLLSP